MKKLESKENPEIKNVYRFLNSKKYRDKEKKFVIEGARLCEDAADSDIIIEKFFYTEKAQNKYKKIVDKLKKKSNESFIVTEKIMDFISDTKTPQGLVCVCEKFGEDFKIEKVKSLKKLIALENIQDPSNLGTIFRTAEALGIEGVILTDDCCDVFSSKVLRGSMGAIFRVPIYTLKSAKDIFELFGKDFNIYATVPDKNAIDIRKVDFSKKCIVLVGNEGNGLKEETIKKCKEKITIPMEGKSESLNAAVAASIVMWEMVKWLMEKEKLKKASRWICIQKCLGYGSRKPKEILKTYKTSEEFFNLTKEDWAKSRFFTAKELSKFKSFDFSVAEKIEETCSQKGYKIITLEDRDYPERLKNIYNPPAVLYVKGTLPNVDKELSLSIVGTRSATKYGLKTSFEFSYNLAKRGAIIASGGALGIDSSAQKGAVLAGGKVISVLGCGIDYKYLERNKSLKEAIAKNGAIISEYEPDYPARGRNFPIRNRIISGISSGTLIVEAGQKSGALITANLALEQGRDLFSVPGDIRSEVSFGTNNLIKECAKPVTSVEDILEEYYLKFPKLEKNLKVDKIEDIIDEDNGKVKVKEQEQIKNKGTESLNISKRAKIIYNLLKREKTLLFDEIALKSNLDAADVLQGLTELEVKKLVKSEPGKRYKKN